MPTQDRWEHFYAKENLDAANEKRKQPDRHTHTHENNKPDLFLF
jgi:hypothetical protein